jgi:hypothetical protein
MKSRFLNLINTSNVFDTAFVGIFMKKLIASHILIPLIGCVSIASAQQVGTGQFVRYGVFGSAGVNYHNAQFSSASEMILALNQPANYMHPFIVNYDLSTRFGWSLGGLIELPIADAFGVSLRASYSQISNRFTAFDSQRFGLLSADGFQVLYKDIRHDYIVDMPTLAHISLDPYITYRPFEMIVLYLGAQVATSVNRRFRAFTSVSDTNGLSGRFFLVDTVENGNYVWNRRTAEFPGMNTLNIGLSGGIGVEIPLENTKQWICAVEVFYTGFLGSLANNLVSYRASENIRLPYLPQPGQIVSDVPITFKQGYWSLSTLRAGISLRYAPFPTAK